MPTQAQNCVAPDKASCYAKRERYWMERHINGLNS